MCSHGGRLTSPKTRARSPPRKRPDRKRLATTRSPQPPAPPARFRRPAHKGPDVPPATNRRRHQAGHKPGGLGCGGDRFAGWGTWIRTKTNRVRVCCATVTPFPTEDADIAALFFGSFARPARVLQIGRSDGVHIASSAFAVQSSLLTRRSRFRPSVATFIWSSNRMLLIESDGVIWVGVTRLQRSWERRAAQAAPTSWPAITSSALKMAEWSHALPPRAVQALKSCWAEAVPGRDSPSARAPSNARLRSF